MQFVVVVVVFLLSKLQFDGNCIKSYSIWLIVVVPKEERNVGISRYEEPWMRKAKLSWGVVQREGWRLPWRHLCPGVKQRSLFQLNLVSCVCWSLLFVSITVEVPGSFVLFPKQESPCFTAKVLRNTDSLPIACLLS